MDLDVLVKGQNWRSFFLILVNAPLGKPCYNFTDAGITIATCYSVIWKTTGRVKKHSPLELKTGKRSLLLTELPVSLLDVCDRGPFQMRSTRIKLLLAPASRRLHSYWYWRWQHPSQQRAVILMLKPPLHARILTPAKSRSLIFNWRIVFSHFGSLGPPLGTLRGNFPGTFAERSALLLFFFYPTADSSHRPPALAT